MSNNTTVWKFVIPRNRTFALAIPAGAEIIHVAATGHDGCMWARVDPTADLVSRIFSRRITGGSDAINPNAKHVGTYIEEDGFVAHIFEGE